MANLQGKGLCCFMHFPTYQFVSHIYYLVLHSPHFTFVHNARPIKQFTRYSVYLAVNQASSQNILFLSYSQQHKSSLLWNVIIPSSKRQLIPPSCIEDATTIKRRRRRRNTTISRISHKSVHTKRVWQGVVKKMLVNKLQLEVGFVTDLINTGQVQCSAVRIQNCRF